MAIVNAVNMIRVDPRVSHSVKVTRFFGEERRSTSYRTRRRSALTCAQSNQVMAELKEKLRSCAALAAGANGAEAEIYISEGVPAAEFDGGIVEDLRLVIGEVLGNENVMPPIVSPGGRTSTSTSRAAALQNSVPGPWIGRRAGTAPPGHKLQP